jgi:hypothetical protein
LTKPESLQNLKRLFSTRPSIYKHIPFSDGGILFVVLDAKDEEDAEEE